VFKQPFWLNTEQAYFQSLIPRVPFLVAVLTKKLLYDIQLLNVGADSIYLQKNIEYVYKINKHCSFLS